MSHDQPDSADRVVVTASDFARLDEPAPRPPTPRPAQPWWAIVTGSVLTLCLPLLAIAAAAIRFALRRRGLERKHLWTRFLCTLLIVSGLLTSFGVAYFYLLNRPAGKVPAELPLGLVSHDGLDEFPALPSDTPMTAVDLAARTRPLVFIVMADPGKPLQSAYLDHGPIGAAVLLHASKTGYLLATNRHVTDPPLPIVRAEASRVLVISAPGSYAHAAVVARHKSADLALLWVARRYGAGAFRQPITRVSKIPVGSSVYVVGHPQGFFFTLSSGLVSRAGSGGMLQLSAPISPGNSGGPAYDPAGNLLGIVTYTVDKQRNPNAENLNFATPAEALLSGDNWDFRDGGQAHLARYIEEQAPPQK